MSSPAADDSRCAVCAGNDRNSGYTMVGMTLTEYRTHRPATAHHLHPNAQEAWHEDEDRTKDGWLFLCSEPCDVLLFPEEAR